MKAILIHVDGKYESINLKTLEDWQKTVGGYVEMVCCGEHASAVVNEDGIALDLPENYLATFLLGYFLSEVDRALLVKDQIRGPVIIVGECDENGTTIDLSQEVIDEIEVMAEIWDVQYKICPKCERAGCMDMCFSCAACYGPIGTIDGMCDECFAAFIRLFSVTDGDYTREQAIAQIDELRGMAWKDRNARLERKDEEIPFLMCPKCKQPLDTGRICGKCRTRWCLCGRRTKSSSWDNCERCEKELGSRPGWTKR